MVQASAKAIRSKVRPFAGRGARRLPAVIGCDEVGRGALCGPVMVAAVWFEPGCLPKGVLARLDDSKRLTREERESLYPQLAGCMRFALAARSAAACTSIARATAPARR